MEPSEFGPHFCKLDGTDEMLISFGRNTPEHPLRVFHTMEGDTVYLASGVDTANMSSILEPTPQQCRRWLIELQRDLSLPSGCMSTLLGVPRVTFDRWRNGQRNPSGAARRLIWLLHRMRFDPKSLTKIGSWVFWGDNAGSTFRDKWESILASKESDRAEKQQEADRHGQPATEAPATGEPSPG